MKPPDNFAGVVAGPPPDATRPHVAGQALRCRMMLLARSMHARHGNTLEPVRVPKPGAATHPAFHNTFRGLNEIKDKLVAGLNDKSSLPDDTVTAADLLMGSALGWPPAFTPDPDVVRDWLAYCEARPARASVDDDTALLSADA
ncbi:MAG: hypothetical protein KKB02_15400 [Alphaproteobacteria bacterium]|nr:hypothetical protein [Alphaproteobacteria bacterium]